MHGYSTTAPTGVSEKCPKYKIASKLENYGYQQPLTDKIGATAGVYAGMSILFSNEKLYFCATTKYGMLLLIYK